jgi:hypothetical protein
MKRRLARLGQTPEKELPNHPKGVREKESKRSSDSTSVHKELISLI